MRVGYGGQAVLDLARRMSDSWGIPVRCRLGPIGLISPIRGSVCSVDLSRPAGRFIALSEKNPQLLVFFPGFRRYGARRSPLDRMTHQKLKKKINYAKST